VLRSPRTRFYEEEYKDGRRPYAAMAVTSCDPGCRRRDENIVTVALDIGERKRVEFEMRKAKDAAEAALRNLRETQNSLIEAEKLAASAGWCGRRPRGQQSVASV